MAAVVSQQSEGPPCSLSKRLSFRASRGQDPPTAMAALGGGEGTVALSANNGFLSAQSTHCVSVPSSVVTSMYK